MLRNVFLIGLIMCLTVLAKAQPAPPSAPAIVITEIMYHSPALGIDSLEFIELRNPSDTNERSLTGHFFSQGIQFAFPTGLLLQGHEFVIVAKDSVAFENTFGIPAFQWGNSSLADDGGVLVLKNNFNQTVDSVNYSNQSPWPIQAAGNGHSIVLCNDTLPNAGPANWSAAASNTGLIINGLPIFANPNADCSETNGLVQLNASEPELFPNPNNGTFFIQLPQGIAPSIVQLKVLDQLGKLVHSSSQQWNSTLAVSLPAELPAGIYFLNIAGNDLQFRAKTMMVR